MRTDPRFETLFTETAPALLAWASLHVRGPLAAEIEPEDLVQEVLLHAYGAFASFDAERGPFRSWVFGVAHHVARDLLRKIARRARLAAQEEGASSRFAALPAPLTTISRRVARREGMQAFLARLSELDRDERRLLLYRGLEGLPHPEVARLLAITPDVARKRWQRLQARLQEAGVPAGVFAP